MSRHGFLASKEQRCSWRIEENRRFGGDNMISDGRRSVDEIRRDTERTREGLTSTVNELRSAVSDTASDIREKLRPEAIKSEVSGYIKSRGEQIVQNLTEAARRNPIQAVAVGASLAFPLLRVARSIPLPVMMIGAGLFLSGSRKGKELTQQASDAAAGFVDEARRRTHDLGDRAAQVASDARDYVTESSDQVKSAAGTALDGARRTVADTAGRMQDGMNSAARETKAAADATTSSISSQADGIRNAGLGAADRLQNQAAQVAATVQGSVTSAVRTGKDYATVARDRLAETSARTGRTLREQIEQTPLAVAGVGLVLGGLLASALPKVGLEDELMGPTSDKLRRRANEAANETFEGAKNAAGEILTNVVQKAKEEGLTPDDLAKGMQDVGERLQHVAERGLTTAFEPEGADHLQTQTQGGDRQNG
jgi:hypothetical protein